MGLQVLAQDKGSGSGVQKGSKGGTATRAWARQPWQLRPRRRGRVPGGTASKTARGGAGEVEGGAVLLTGCSIWAEENRKEGIDGGGGASVRLQWWAAQGSRFRQRKRSAGLEEGP